MNWRIIRTIFLKECLDTLRDRRAVIAMVVVPVLLYPAIFIIGAQGLIVQQARIEATASRVAVSGDAREVVAAWLETEENVELREVEEPREALLSGRLDAVIETGEGSDPEAGLDSLAVRILYDSVEPRSTAARERLQSRLQERSRELVRDRVAAANLPEGFARPLALSSEDTASTERRTGFFLGSILPLLMVLMLGVGAFYPAIDLTAGEKERGTFETLLATPAGKLNIVWGKFLTVFLICMVTGILNLGSMAVSVLFQLSMVEETLGEFGLTISWDMLLIAFCAMVPLAFFVSAIMMAIAVLARSFKEAQNLVTPFFLAMIFPATYAAMPGMTLNAFNQFIPIANVALLFKALFLGEATIEGAFAVIVSTAAFALLALQLATWLFQQDEMLLAEDRGFAFLRRRSSFEPQSTPTMTMGLFLFGFTMLLLFYPGTYAQSQSIYSGLLITQYGFILLPTLLLLWYARIDLRESLSLRMPGLASLAAIVPASLAWIVLQSQTAVWQARALPFPDALRDAFEQLLDTTQIGVIPLLFIVAVTPAICEEVMFRGAMLSSFRRRMPAWAAILLVGLLFGIFHLSVHRLLLTALSGVLLTWIVYRSRSLAHGVLAHFLINGSAILVVTGNLPEFMLRVLADPELEQTGLPMWMLLGAALVFLASMVAFAMSTRRQGNSLA